MTATDWVKWHPRHRTVKGTLWFCAKRVDAERLKREIPLVFQTMVPGADSRDTGGASFEWEDVTEAELLLIAATLVFDRQGPLGITGFYNYNDRYTRHEMEDVCIVVLSTEETD